MSRLPSAISSRTRSQRGLIALSLAVSFMLIMFTALLSYTLGLAAQRLRVEKAWAATQALYAAEAGLDVALQTGEDRVVGNCGRARYAAITKGRQVTALGQVPRASGAPIRRAITVQTTSSGRVIRGSWQLVSPAGQQQLIAVLEQFEEQRP